MTKGLHCEYGILNKRGVITLFVMTFFFAFTMMFSLIATLKMLDRQQQSLAQKAFDRINMEIEALKYLHRYNPRHHDAIYIYDHWITFWYKDDTMIIWFDGYYDYYLVLHIDEHQRPISSEYIYD